MGVRYTWGGETKVGIDCSGLARTALIEAMIIQGWRKGNARIMWPIAWRLWLHDAGASAMMQEAYGYTCVIGKAGVLSSPETIRMNLGFTLQPGDLGVAGSGCHVMIYTGNGRWIEANPDDGRVVENMADSSKRAYFNLRIVILRWWML
jgi:cell wall-associated NlpC family hydrolase